MWRLIVIWCFLCAQRCSYCYASHLTLSTGIYIFGWCVWAKIKWFLHQLNLSSVWISKNFLSLGKMGRYIQTHSVSIQQTYWKWCCCCYFVLCHCRLRTSILISENSHSPFHMREKHSSVFNVSVTDFIVSHRRHVSFHFKQTSSHSFTHNLHSLAYGPRSSSYFSLRF